VQLPAPLLPTGHSYADLEPYYTKVEWEGCAPDWQGASPFESAALQALSHAAAAGEIQRLIFDTSRAQTWMESISCSDGHSFRSHVPDAVPASIAVFCLAFGCEVGAKSSSLASMIPLAERSGKCEIRPNSYVHKIEVTSAGRAIGAVYFDEKKNVHLQRAKAVILSPTERRPRACCCFRFQ